MIIRIGPNTTRTFRQRSDPGVRLGENDSYFIDLGLVFDSHEGDVGDTFVVGHAPERQACAEAARTLFDEVAQGWRMLELSGQAPYAFAHERATAMGWRLNHAIKGRRVSDFPHAVHHGGDPGGLDAVPSNGPWVLEIQIAHPTEPFGAFYEDLLSDAPAHHAPRIREPRQYALPEAQDAMPETLQAWIAGRCEHDDEGPATATDGCSTPIRAARRNTPDRQPPRLPERAIAALSPSQGIITGLTDLQPACPGPGNPPQNMQAHRKLP